MSILSNDLLADGLLGEHIRVVSILKQTRRKTMRDDYQSAAWADHHGELSAAVDRLFHAIGHTFNRLNAQQFDAPWRPRSKTRTAARH
ncbi:hypothetical protein G4G27_05075 [Sphingomonas sp. So64.6b]|uniref:hypothetical protein n=1 Tax=Sphingomonas sp. So64.6b TaxID=2997354 RepID=UPI001600D844|nr:hypothetical protein [Sphingomonas sp. So64.6b]QNA83443.1 hypothetical protein G4G27_05075 [Sphingomonas sp. So64.6b]